MVARRDRRRGAAGPWLRPGPAFLSSGSAAGAHAWTAATLALGLTPIIVGIPVVGATAIAAGLVALRGLPRFGHHVGVAVVTAMSAMVAGHLLAFRSAGDAILWSEIACLGVLLLGLTAGIAPVTSAAARQTPRRWPDWLIAPTSRWLP